MNGGKKAVWAAIAASLGWSGWRFVRYGEEPTRRIAGTLAAGSMLLFVADMNEQFAGALAWLAILGATIGNVGALPTGSTEGKK